MLVQGLLDSSIFIYVYNLSFLLLFQSLTGNWNNKYYDFTIHIYMCMYHERK